MNPPIRVTVQDVFDYHAALDAGHEIACMKANAPQIADRAPYPFALSPDSIWLLQQYQDSVKAHDWARAQALAQVSYNNLYGCEPNSSPTLGSILAGILR